ncbi:hypothetical protein Plhal304r1_c005g0022101 [Plasmopara halstedii]
MPRSFMVGRKGKAESESLDSILSHGSAVAKRTNHCDRRFFCAATKDRSCAL